MQRSYRASDAMVKDTAHPDHGKVCIKAISANNHAFKGWLLFVFVFFVLQEPLDIFLLLLIYSSRELLINLHEVHSIDVLGEFS